MSKYSYTFCLWAAKHVHLFVFEKHFQFPPFAQFSCNQFKLASSASQRSKFFLELLSHLVSNLKLGVVFACNNFHGITYLLHMFTDTWKRYSVIEGYFPSNLIQTSTYYINIVVKYIFLVQDYIHTYSCFYLV